ncbi:MAG TPA: 2-phosphosulfolactate phosphatase [Acidimicrobiia bacterium]|nr:2-phosphosulfolactate phosphatase [Acidimicrobiia bacterium]
MTIDFAWGRPGVYALVESGCRTIVVVDVLRFTTAVDVGVSRGAAIYPYRWHDGTEHAYAKSHDAELAVKGFDVDNDHPWSLSPVGLARIPAGTKLVLPSPNGATIAFEAAERGDVEVVAGCLRNARAVASFLRARPDRVGVVASGEQWKPDEALRPAVEDLLGAGAIIHALDPEGRDVTPDAGAAAGAFVAMTERLEWALLECPSGRELRGHGWDADVRAAAEHGVSECVPVLVDGCFVDGSGAAARMGE